MVNMGIFYAVLNTIYCEVTIPGVLMSAFLRFPVFSFEVFSALCFHGSFSSLSFTGFGAGDADIWSFSRACLAHFVPGSLLKM
jgi:hypothetical protein